MVEELIIEQAPMAKEELNEDQAFTKWLLDRQSIVSDNYPYGAATELFKEKYNKYPSCEDWNNMPELVPESEIRLYLKRKANEEWKKVLDMRKEKSKL